MSEGQKPPHGQIAWIDLTVPDAGGLREFYTKVVGWEFDAVKMDGYEDYSMKPAGASDAIAGICHARESNATMPPSWMIYITVPDVDAAVAACEALGGKVVVAPRGEKARFCVIEDPAGAVCALFETP